MNMNEGVAHYNAMLELARQLERELAEVKAQLAAEKEEHGTLKAAYYDQTEGISAELARSSTAPTAKQQFDELIEYGTSPLERLRFFCSLAMNGQDWLDVEPFFEALEAPVSATRDNIIEECAKAIEPANHPLLMAAVKVIRELKCASPDGGAQK